MAILIVSKKLDKQKNNSSCTYQRTQNARQTTNHPEFWRNRQITAKICLPGAEGTKWQEYLTGNFTNCLRLSLDCFESEKLGGPQS